MASTTAQPIRVTNPANTRYDEGIDIQPNTSWSKLPPAAAPTVVSSTTTTTTSTSTAPAVTSTPAVMSTPSVMSTPAVTFTPAVTASPAGASMSTAAALERNINPVDKEDPQLATKALPFGSSSPAEIASNVVTPVEQYPQHAGVGGGSDWAEHNGNILDRTMDQIRTWIHSFRGGAPDEYETYMEEADDNYQHQHQPSTLDNAKASLQGVQQQAASKLQSVTAAASQQATQVTETVRHQAEVVQARVGDAMSVVGERASAAAGQVKASVQDFIAAHQTRPGEPLTSTISNSINAQLPSQEAVKEQIKTLVPPLAQQASSSYALLGSFVSQYLATYRSFLLALRRQSLPLQMMTALLVVTHGLLPWLFLDKEPARSVLYCTFIVSVLSHLTFFLSGHLRYLFLAHLVYVPMLVSLTLHAGFGEAGDVDRVVHQMEEGSTMKATLMAPLSLRSYLFVLWLRVVLMTQSALLTLDAVNVLDMLGFSLETRRGQEMQLINRSVAQMRRSFAHNIAPPQQTSATGTRSQQQQQQPAGVRRRHSRSGQGQASTALVKSAQSASSQPQQQQQQQQRSVSPSAPQRWVKKGDDAGQTNEEQVVVQSHEKMQHQPQHDLGLRERKPHTAGLIEPPAVHPTYYVNNERV